MSLLVCSKYKNTQFHLNGSRFFDLRIDGLLVDLLLDLG